MIPPQLCSPDFRFVKIKTREKRPYEIGWTTTKNYAYNDPELIAHLNQGGNYGVLCGPGGLRVLDADEPRLHEKLNGNLPKTLRIKTGGGGTHDYYICEGIPKLVLDDGEHLGELQGPGTQVVGPGSLHPNGNRYEIINDAPLTTIKKEEMYTALTGFIKREKEKSSSSLPVYSTIHLNITDIVSTHLRRRGSEYQGEHPIHGSDGGTNFCVNPSKNVWHCFRCDSGGGPLEWIAVKEGIINCSDAKRGCLGGARLKEVLQIAREKYGYTDPLDELEKRQDKSHTFNYAEYKELFDSNRARDARYHLANQITQSHYLKTHDENNTVYAFNGRCYIPFGSMIIKRDVEQNLKELASIGTVKEIEGHVQRRTYTPEDTFDKPVNWVCLNNGVLDIETLEFAPHTPEFVSRNIIPVDYDPDADCPAIKKFLSEVITEEDITLIQELAGYFLLKDYPYQKAFMFLGSGANGKSTLIGLFQAFLGRDNLSNVSLQDLTSNKFAAAQLVGKLGNLYPDLPDKTIQFSGMFKVLTGGDYVNVEKKFKDGFSYKNYAKLVFSCNELPETKDTSDAFFRRWLFVNFPHKFEGKDADKGLLNRLTTPEELSGFLNWALKGLTHLRDQDGFSSEVSTEAMRKQYQMLSSPLGAFASAEMEYDRDAFVFKDDMYEAFVTFCEEQNIPICSNDKFNKNIQQYAPKIRTERLQVDEKRKWAWAGYRLLSNEHVVKRKKNNNQEDDELIEREIDL